MIKKLPDNESPDISVHRALDSPSSTAKRTVQDATTGTGRSRKDSTNIYCIDEASNTKRQLFQEEEETQEKQPSWKIDLKKFQEALDEEKKLKPFRYDLLSKKIKPKDNFFVNKRND